MAAFALSYALLQLLSMQTAAGTIGKIIWLPGGIAAAGLLLYGIRLWPGIFSGAFIGSLLWGDSLIQGFLFALGNTLDPLLGVWLLRHVIHDFDIRLARQRDLWLLILCVCVVGPLLNTAIGVPASLLSGSPPSPDYAHLLLDWWLPVFTGGIALTPLVLMQATRKNVNLKLLQRPKEAILLALLIVTVNWVVWYKLGDIFSRHAGSRLLIPFFIWAAARMGQRGTGLLSLLVLGQDIWMMHLNADRSALFFEDRWDLWLFGILLTLCSQFAALLFNERENASKALRDSEERHRISQKYGGIGTWEADLINHLQIWSENCTHIMGFPAPREKPTWENFLLAIHPEDRSAVIDATHAHLEYGTPYEVEYRIITKDGQTRWMRSVGQVERDARGVPVRMRGIVEDITAEALLSHSLKESENRHRALLQNARDAILIADLNGNIEEINRAGEALLGYDRDEICRMNIIQIHPDAELPRVKQHFSQIVTEGCITPITTQILCKDHRIVDVEIRPTLVEIDGRKVAQGIFIDRTEQVRAEKERLTQRDTLVREVHHRIKNNLQGVTGVLRQFAETHPEIAEPLNHAISQVQSVAVIHGLQGRADIEKIRFCELVLAIAAGIESLWQKPATVKIPDHWVPCTIAEAEAVPLALVLNELITNAIKHGRDVQIFLSRAPLTDVIRLSIYNTGRLPANFEAGRKTAFGTGLHLVSALLPRSGAGLAWEQQEMVVTTLTLAPPVIRLESGHIEHI